MLAYLPYLRARLAALTGDRKGVTSLEYGVIAAIMVGAVVAAWGLLPAPLNALLGAIAGDLKLGA